MDVLKDKNYIQYPYISRYSIFPEYYNTLDNRHVYGVTAYLKNNTSYVNHIVKKGDTYDSLALSYYNNPTYYWAILSFNRKLDPFEELKVGSTIKIPTLSAIEYM